MSDLAVVMASGGMDSCVTAALAREQGCALAMAHVTYGQLTHMRELRAFGLIADQLEVPVERRLVVDVGFLSQIGGSALTDERIPVPDAEAVEPGAVPVSYVPQRNGNLLFIGAAWADVIGAGSVWAGMVEADSSGYPDCRREFVDAIEQAIALGNPDDHPDPEIVTPLIEMSKRQIVELGVSIGAPLELSWSCYRNEDLACGRCDSCRLRLRGFREAGIDDPISYVSAEAGDR
jgi:7-cyano-7-deazaguanine synthase